MGYIDQIQGSDSFLESAGDFFISPARLFLGDTYYLEEGILKRPETFLTLPNLAARITAVVLFPFSLLSTLFGLTLKAIAYRIEPALKDRCSLPILYNARTAVHFNGKLPPNPWTPNCVNSQQKSFWGALYNAEPIAVPREMENPVAEMKQLLAQQNCILTEEKENYLHYEYTVDIPSGPLKGTYTDDLDLYFDAAASCFHIRSASRTGFRDALHFDFKQMGANKKRIEAIRQAFSIKYLN